MIKVGNLSKHQHESNWDAILFFSHAFDHLLTWYIYIHNTGLEKRLSIAEHAWMISALYHWFFSAGSEITKVTEQLLQAIANSDYEMYK